MPLYVFNCLTHGRIEVSLPQRRPYYLCERCGRICERVSATEMTRVGSNALQASGIVSPPDGPARRD
jgi:hypothetical protein